MKKYFKFNRRQFLVLYFVMFLLLTLYLYVELLRDSVYIFDSIYMFMDVIENTLIIGLILIGTDFIIKRRQKQQETRRLIIEISSPDNAIALNALRMLRKLGWLEEGILRSADFTGANLETAELGNLDISFAILQYANLKSSNLSYSKLRGVDAKNSDLSNASLVDVDLRYANLTGANLYQADMRGANLEGAILVNVNVENIKIDKTTILPEFKTTTHVYMEGKEN